MVSQYLQVLARHSINVFSGASFALGLFAAIVFRLGDVANAIIITAAAFTSILIAGYFAWKEAVEKLPKGADLSIVCDSVVFTSTGTSGGVPHSPMRFGITLDAINRGEEPAILRMPEVTKFEMNNEFLGNAPQKTEFASRNQPYGSRQIHASCTIEPGQRLTDLEYSIFVELKSLEPEEFARRLPELQDYEIELSYTFEDMERTPHTRTIPICGSFEDYVEERIREWSENPKQHNLVVAALKAKGLIRSN